jgi:hypothetical protein
MANSYGMGGTCFELNKCSKIKMYAIVWWNVVEYYSTLEDSQPRVTGLVPRVLLVACARIPNSFLPSNTNPFDSIRFDSIQFHGLTG